MYDKNYKICHEIDHNITRKVTEYQCVYIKCDKLD